MLLDALEEEFFKGSNFALKVSHEGNAFLLMIAAEDPSFREEVQKAVDAMNPSHLQVASTGVHIQDTPCLGFVFRAQEKSEELAFEKVIRNALEEWEEKTFGQRNFNEIGSN